MTYKINLPYNGSYKVEYRVASELSGSILRLEKAGGAITYGTINVPNTGGWQKWTSIAHNVYFNAGEQDLAIVSQVGSFNINYLIITPNTDNIPYGSYITIMGNNNLFVSSENGTVAMTCNRSSAQAWEKFLVVKVGNGLVALKGSNGKFVSSENGSLYGLYCNRNTIDAWETFSWISQGTSSFSLKGNNGKYVTSNNGSSPITCDITNPSGWEIFNWAATTKSAPISSDETNSTSDNLLIYPNPASGFVNLRTEISGYNISVYDCLGRVVLKKVGLSGNSHLDITNLKSGLYLIQLKTKNAEVYYNKLEIK